MLKIVWPLCNVLSSCQIGSCCQEMTTSAPWGRSPCMTHVYGWVLINPLSLWHNLAKKAALACMYQFITSTICYVASKGFFLLLSCAWKSKSCLFPEHKNIYLVYAPQERALFSTKATDASDIRPWWPLLQVHPCTFQKRPGDKRPRRPPKIKVEVSKTLKWKWSRKFSLWHWLLTQKTSLQYCSL